MGKLLFDFQRFELYIQNIKALIQSYKENKEGLYKFVCCMPRSAFQHYNMTMESIKSWITGHHIYKGIWTPVLGEVFVCCPDVGNSHDVHAVKVINSSGVTIGRVPHELALHFYAHLQMG